MGDDDQDVFNTTPSASSMMLTAPRMSTVDMDALLEVETQLARFKKLKDEQEAQILHLRALQDKVAADDCDDEEFEDRQQQQQQHGGDVDQDALKDMLLQMQGTPNTKK